MTERQITYIRYIAEQKSVQKAAVLLNKSPSTLSRAVKTMEQELGLSLFRRSPDGLELTAEGKMVSEYGRWIQARFSALPGSSWTENEVRYLLAIRENGNISRAAEELYIAQPSLSQMVQSIEKMVGNTIFLRNREGIEETEYGKNLLNDLEQIQQLFQKMHEELEEFRQMKKGTIQLGIPMNLGTYLLPAVLPAFEQVYPGIEVRFRENNSSELGRMAAARKVDFAIMHFQEQQENLDYELFSEDPFYLVVPSAWKQKLPFEREQVLHVEELKKIGELPFIMVANRQKLRQVADEILTKSRIDPVIRYTTKSMETAKRLTAAGMGITFLPYSYLTLFSGVDELEYFRLDENLNASWKLVAAYAEGTRLSRKSREFLKVLKKFFDVV